MNYTPDFIAALDADGCKELPFVETAAQTYFDYVNGSSGYIVFVVGAALLVVGLVSRKFLGKMPGWLGGIIVVALVLSALPALLPAFGVDLGCGGTTTQQDSDNDDQEEEPAQENTPAGAG